MINGAHVIVYSKDPDADRAFLRDVLNFPHVDAGHGWLVFRLPPAEVAFHPTDGEAVHQLYLMCDDLDATLADLAAKGADVSAERTEARWGIIGSVKLPSGTDLALYQPLHPVAYNLGD